MGPCNSGKTASTPAFDSKARASDIAPMVSAGVPGSSWRWPVSASRESRSRTSSPTAHAPDLEIPIGTTSYLASPMAPSTPRAVSRLMSCSPEVPPKMTPIRSSRRHGSPAPRRGRGGGRHSESLTHSNHGANDNDCVALDLAGMLRRLRGGKGPGLQRWNRALQVRGADGTRSASPTMGKAFRHRRR